MLMMQALSSMSEERVQEEGEEVAEEVVEEGKHDKHAKKEIWIKLSNKICMINMKYKFIIGLGSEVVEIVACKDKKYWH